MDFLQMLQIDSKALLPTLVCLSTGIILYKYYVNYYSYWARRGVKGNRTFFIFGELSDLLLRNRLQLISERTKKYGKIWGTYVMGKPKLIVADPEVVRDICIRDFDVFPNHNLNDFLNKYQKLFLLYLRDDHWRRVRAMMSPSFTSGKIKRMYKLLDGCSDDLVDNFKEQFIGARRAGLKSASVDLFKTYSMYTMDGITTCCYGVKLQREKGLTDMQKMSTRNSLVRDCSQVFAFHLGRFTIGALFPKFLLRALNFASWSEPNFEPLKDRVAKLVEIRRQGGSSRYDDFLQSLVDAKHDDNLELNEMDQAENHHACLTKDSLLRDQENLKATFIKGTSDSSKSGEKSKLVLDDSEIYSEAILLLAAGLDPTRSSMSTITYLLSHNPEVQERLYRELKAIAKYEDTAVGKRLTFDYEELTACQYLDAVISESLRIFGPVAFIDRQANQDYYVEKYGITITKGSQIVLSLHSVHNDPDYWQEPEKFNPDRFMPGQRERIVPGSYFPFGLGPRHCVGMRFSLTETKLGLAKVVMNFKFDSEAGAAYPPKPALGTIMVHAKNCVARVSLRE